MRRLLVLGLILTMLLLTVGCEIGGEETYRLTVASGEELLHEQPAKRYCAGEQVTIKVGILYDADVECFVNGESIGIQTPIRVDDKYSHWEYYFTMPAENVSVTLKTVGGKWG